MLKTKKKYLFNVKNLKTCTTLYITCIICEIICWVIRKDLFDLLSVFCANIIHGMPLYPFFCNNLTSMFSIYN